MRLASLLFVPVLLALCPGISFAQFQFPLVPFRQLPQNQRGWRTFFRDAGIPDNAFHDAINTRTQARVDGKQVTIITNVSQEPLFYWGYGGASPQLYIEEMRGELWLPISYDWCETGLSRQKLMPGQSQAVSFPVSLAGQKRRFWTLFSNTENPTASSPPPYLPWLSSAYDINVRPLSPVKTSLVLLKEEILYRWF